MTLEEFEKKLDERDGIYRLNLANDVEREYCLRSFGGEENLKNNYPVLHEAYLKAWEEAKNTDRTDEEPPFNFDVDDITVEQKEAEAASTNQNVTGYHLATYIGADFLDTNGSLIDYQPADKFDVFVYGTVRDATSSRPAYAQFQRLYKQVNNIIDCYTSAETYDKEEFENCYLRCRATITIIGKQNALDAYAVSKTKRFGDPVNTPIENIRIDAPISINTETHQIRILYGRTAKNLEYPDYIYSTNNATADNRLWTIIPMRGEVKLEKPLSGDVYYTFEELTVPDKGAGETLTRPVLDYDNKKKKTYRYDLSDDQLYKEYTDGKHFQVTTGQGGEEILKFDLFNSNYGENEDRRYDWVNDIDDAPMDEKDRICYLHGGFSYDIALRDKNGHILAVPQYDISCRSVDFEKLKEGDQYYKYVPGRYTVLIPPIRLWWGCHAKDAQIKLADGSHKRADAIMIGDRLIAYGNKILTVNNIYYGDEEELVSVKTDCGHHICVSEGHPLLWEDGTDVNAASLSVGDKILAESGLPVTVTEITKVPYNDQVYNFSFEGENQGNYVVADGLYSGDLFAQNMRRERKLVPTQEKRAIWEELDRLVQQMNNR